MIWDNTLYLFVVILGFTSLIGPLVTFLKEPKNKAYFFLGILGIIAGPVWAFSTVSFLLTDTLSTAKLWADIIYLASISIGLFHYIFSTYYLRRKKINLLFALFVVGGFIFLLYEIFFTNNFIERIVLEGDNYIVVGKAYLVWMAWLTIVFAINVYKTLKGYKELSFIEKEQQKYLIIGNVLTVVGSFPANIIAPYFGVYEYIWFGPVVFSIANLIISYGLTQTRFQRLGIVIRGLLRSLSLYIIPSVIFVVSLEFLFPLIEQLEIPKLLFYIIAFLLALIFKIIVDAVANIFLSEKQILRNKGEGFIKLLNFEQELSDICNKTLDYICQNTSANKAQIYLYDSINTKSYRFTHGDWKIENLNKIFAEIPVYWNKETSTAGRLKSLSRSELEYLSNKDALEYREYSNLLYLLELSKIQIVYPIVSGSELIGVLFIQDLPNNQMYKIDELDLWDRIYSQFHISVNKALLYKQLQSFNQTLQSKVDYQTAELQVKIQELQEARRKENDMIDIMGHELRTPATIVKLNAQLLEKFTGDIQSDPEAYKRYVDRIKMAVENEIRLINTLLSSAKLEGDKIVIDPEEVDIRSEVDMAIHGHERDAREKNLPIINNMQLGTPCVYADKARVVEILNNLIGNAVKYTERGSVTIENRYDDNWVEVSVVDTGNGISAEELPKLGQKFFRAGNYIDSNMKVGDKIDIVRPGGTGLGLFVTFNLIRKMGGAIRVESEVGKGSKFIFVLPRYKAQAIHDHNGESKNMFEKLGLRR